MEKRASFDRMRVVAFEELLDRWKGEQDLPRGRSRPAARWAMLAAMRRAVSLICIIIVGLSLGACTKCGWLWDQGPRSCHSDAPR